MCTPSTVARTALEKVCSRCDMALRDGRIVEDLGRVRQVELLRPPGGLDGVRRSTELYRMVFNDLGFESSTRSPRTSASPAAGS